MAEQANAAIRISGADHSSWNGKLRDTTTADGDVRGVAGWDHTIAYDRASVSEPLGQMVQYAGHYNQDAESLQSYREAVKTVLHENVHMLADKGSDHAQAKAAFANGPGVRQAEEGFTELYSQQQLNAYIDDLGLAEVAPGIKEANAAVAYKRYLPAAERVAEDIGRTTGLGGEEVARRMAAVTADRKFLAAAEMIYDHSDLPGLIPSDQRDAAVQRIAAAMGPEFARVDGVTSSDPEQCRRESAVVGAATVKAARGVIRNLRRETMPPAQEQQVQNSLGVEQRPGTSQESASRGPLEPTAPELPPDVASAARVGLSCAQPLRTASRLTPDHQGARRTSTSPTPAHHRGPKTHTSR